MLLAVLNRNLCGLPHSDLSFKQKNNHLALTPAPPPPPPMHIIRTTKEILNSPEKAVKVIRLWDTITIK